MSNYFKFQTLCLTTKEAADLIRLSPRTLEGMRSDGTGPRFIKLGIGPKAKVAYRLVDLEDWLASRVCIPHRPILPEDENYVHVAT